MEFRADDGREATSPVVPGINDRILVVTNEVICQREEIISFFPVAPANFFRRKNTIRPGRMSVKVAAVEPARCRKRVRHGALKGTIAARTMPLLSAECKPPDQAAIASIVDP